MTEHSFLISTYKPSGHSPTLRTVVDKDAAIGVGLSNSSQLWVPGHSPHVAGGRLTGLTRGHLGPEPVVGGDYGGNVGTGHAGADNVATPWANLRQGTQEMVPWQWTVVIALAPQHQENEQSKHETSLNNIISYHVSPFYHYTTYE